ncbi:hypothetical protein HYH03_013286 [Edaphochlamys debaryana]|uniref:Uncharacterized protein n=1 Tax=Edaphochlamys debaryana TaxID=47281 RepID=A0A836BT36_9CHLO|nr:hypothetical protein HYH03_013286 [Edaphochlamys debaryana]|eukprot:KAG2488141.1 hypothetical protein HYH03_013286 [Edaphochlamys debaryana]
MLSSAAQRGLPRALCCGAQPHLSLSAVASAALGGGGGLRALAAAAAGSGGSGGPDAAAGSSRRQPSADELAGEAEAVLAGDPNVLTPDAAHRVLEQQTVDPSAVAPELRPGGAASRLQSDVAGAVDVRARASPPLPGTTTGGGGGRAGGGELGGGGGGGEDRATGEGAGVVPEAMSAREMEARVDEVAARGSTEEADIAAEGPAASDPRTHQAPWEH